ncbi:Type I secretion system ATP-binding protein PrsD [Thiorhodovibrio winogradskyi]|uniref:Type I secretion system ATP-binding protein PrsD n=1 Tax=Thiorhodovibrio winogradskyi TaxID=77007 RepID=A0ABZ0SCC4_9GAMM|nr:type I secretion system permease/ATPase [Thiorhodovibrio winogradskyi]
MTKTPPGAVKQALLQCRGTVISAFFFSVLISLLMLAPILFMMQLYDRIIPSRSVPTLVVLFLLVVFLLAIMGLLMWVRTVMMFRVSARLDSLISERIFNAMVDFARRSPGKETTQPMEDLTTLRMFLGSATLVSFFDLPLVPVFLTIIFLFHPLLGFLTLGGAVILFIIALINEMISREPAMLASEQAIRERQALAANLRNVEVMEAMGMRNSIFARWRNQHTQTIGWQAIQSEHGSVPDTLSRALTALLRPIILAAAGYLAIQQLITPGVIIAAAILSGKTVGPIGQVIGNWKSFLGARASYDRLHHLLETMPEQPRRLSMPIPTGRLQLHGVFARPPGTEKPVLRGISLDLEPGEALGVVGPSAAGKSTLARVILGVWPALSGSVRLDGVEVSLYNRDELGRHLGYLPQDTELFAGTIAENIARFQQMDDALVVHAAQRAHIHDLIGQLPDGYNTLIGPGGVGLSGGQRQRIALARALYDAPRLVILDEPNASLDDRGESALFAALAEMRDIGCTVVVISHRPNLLKAVDKVLVLKEGQVEGFGPRAEVLSRVLKPKSLALPEDSLPRLQAQAS